MTWTGRQRAMLREMGVRLWTSEPDPAASAAAQAVAVASTAGAAPARGAAAPSTPTSTPPSSAPLLSTPSLVTPPPVAAAQGQLQTDPALLSSVAQMDWPALRQAVAACTACGLCQSRTQTVFGSGYERAHWMVVGEAPGEQEDKTGAPFVGPAGQLLDRMLAALQISRTVPSEPVEVDAARQVYIANTLKCRPPRNRNPAPDEMQRCEPFLLRQIDLLQPRIILAMGAFAVKALLRSDEPVGRLRGQVHRYHGVPLVVTYHPSYLLRQPAEKAKAWDDLCLAMETVQRLPRGV